MCVIVQAKILGRMWGALPEDEKMRYQHVNLSLGIVEQCVIGSFFFERM